MLYIYKALNYILFMFCLSLPSIEDLFKNDDCKELIIDESKRDESVIDDVVSASHDVSKSTDNGMDEVESILPSAGSNTKSVKIM